MTLRSYLARLIWLSLAPLLLLTAWLGVEHVGQRHAELDRTAERLAHNVATAIDFELRERIGALQVLAMSPLLDDPADWPALYSEARAFQASFGSHVILYDNSAGHRRFHTALPYGAEMPPLPQPAGRSALGATLESRRPEIGDRFDGPVAGEPLAAIAVPSLRGQQLRFVTVGLLPLRHLQQRLVAYEIPTGWSLELVDSRGERLAHHGADLAGAARQVVDVRTEAAPWTIRLVLPNADHATPLLRAAAGIAVAVAGLTLTGVVGANWASRRLSRAMRSLVRPTGTGAVHEADGIDEIAAVRRRIEGANIELAVRESQLRGIFESATDAIVTTDEAQRIVMANPAASRVFRYPIEELVGMPLGALLPERYRAGHRAHMLAFGASESTSRHMGTHDGVAALRSDGEEFPIEGAISQAHVDGHRLYTIVLRDVTERRRAERELLESKARLEAALANMTDAVCIADAHGRVTHLNEAFATFHRFASTELCPRTLDGYPPLIEMGLPDTGPATPEHWPAARALRGESATLAEYRLRRRDSGASWVGSYGFAPIRGHDGSVVGAVVVARDVTHLRRVQAELQASHADLQRLIAAKDSVQEDERKRIARELHDDLQQTLAAVLMEAGAARGAGLPPAAQRPLERIEELATQALASTRRIVNDLRPRLLEDLGLLPALESLAGGFSAWSGVACTVDDRAFDGDGGTLPASVTTCLYRVAQEALNNVAKHAEATTVRIRLEGGAGVPLRLTIRDDGKGLRTQDRRKPGTFGLLGMQERVRAVGGSLQIAGEPAGGTTVTVEVPAHQPDGTDRGGAEPAQRGAGAARDDVFPTTP